MGSKTNHHSAHAKTQFSASKKSAKRTATANQAAKKRHQRWSKDRSERVRDALNRDTDLLYNALENPPAVPPSVSQTDFVVSLAQGMQGLHT